ncbi:MAG: DUF2147 domain-containing protein [Bacteroidales bacterium]|nr:DUF2147 domain-containing protein [Bacteroidales bacterium]HOY38994.1 DUF2147 domain-containing protein [Bacteroidales bacterium]HQP03456.1 DUF2147 domain-containing protein [Bacteroidales bacterium]
MKQVAVFLLAVFSALVMQAQDVTGKWITVDDQTGIEKSVVQIYEKDGKLYGKVIAIIDKSKGENPLCTKCSGTLKDKPILGMIVVRGLSKTKDGWFAKNAFLEPESGWIVDGKLWLEGNELKVRADVGIFHRTQTWKRLR